MFRYNDVKNDINNYFKKYDLEKKIKDIKNIERIYNDWLANNDYFDHCKYFNDFFSRYKNDKLDLIYNMLLDSLEYYNNKYGNKNEKF